MEGRFTFLGTGAATGVPVIGCQCAICLSESPLNKRKRSCSLFETHNKKFLIDVGPDFRSQALKHHITELDGLILTHTHYDHVAGIDDLRIFAFKKKIPLPVLLSKDTMTDLQRRYFYLVEEKSPKLKFQILEENAFEVDFLGLKLQYFFHDQVGMQVTGYRFGDLAFITDIKHYPQSMFDRLKGCNTLILSAVDWKQTRAHIGIEEAIEIGEKVKAQKVFLTHIGHELDHESTNEKLPKFMQLAYDGLSITCRL
jgi:phosphoribosyl 1,2-cyclic phosphate phosphodiesterase